MGRGRNSLLPEEKHRRALKNFCIALAKGDQATAKKELDVIESAQGKGELWNGFLWGLNGMYEAAVRKDVRALFVMAYSRLSADEIKKVMADLRREEGALFLSERERGVFEANLFGLETVVEALEKGTIKRENQQGEEAPIVDDEASSSDEQG
ncbi:MAG: hypothetical protein ACP5T5_04670 [Thermoprotei archaeon]